VLEPEYLEGLKDMEGFERVWLLYWFDRAAIPSELIVTPYLEDTPHGVFATRAPARPNPIGMSPVRLLSVEGNVLRLADVDILDGTPLLDIQPYAPRFDCFQTTRNDRCDALGDHHAVADGRFEKESEGRP
jgi:tRNA-Thr(GGU) m(6)t(6)A37 methyltransferase TsaA